MNDTDMPQHVAEWLRQFPGETITIRMAENGNVRIWTRDPNHLGLKTNESEELGR